VCERARSNGEKILLSGQGADEIFSDYGFGGVKKYNHSNFGGLFPKDLSEIFPWASFYNSSMESYLAKEEYVAGSYGIETRYPFLDMDVVQEFLWLDSDLKNNNYKSPLHQYLKINNFPFEENQKIGF
jgi:asparagine synthetase B (glutamine-hydrolysing)